MVKEFSLGLFLFAALLASLACQLFSPQKVQEVVQKTLLTVAQVVTQAAQEATSVAAPAQEGPRRPHYQAPTCGCPPATPCAVAAPRSGWFRKGLSLPVPRSCWRSLRPGRRSRNRFSIR